MLLALKLVKPDPEPLNEYADTVPETSSLEPGFDVPIPTSPLESILNLSLLFVVIVNVLFCGNPNLETSPGGPSYEI